jgi:DNA processing protein
MPVSAQSVATGASLNLAEEEIAKAKTADAQIITPADEAFPRRLLEIYDPPLCLYIRGNVLVLSEPGIAVVGTPASCA